MVLGSHNSWTYLNPRYCWMKLFKFFSKCQDNDIKTQYLSDGVRCFDLRIRFNKNGLVVAHGLMTYDITEEELYRILEWLNDCGDTSVRILHEIRNKAQYTAYSYLKFREFCKNVETRFKNIKFWCGKNLYNWTTDYEFKYNPSCEEKYSSVCAPKLIDDWYPRWFAKKNNHAIIEEGTDKDILLIDFVNYQ